MMKLILDEFQAGLPYKYTDKKPVIPDIVNTDNIFSAIPKCVEWDYSDKLEGIEDKITNNNEILIEDLVDNFHAPTVHLELCHADCVQPIVCQLVREALVIQKDLLKNIGEPFPIFKNADAWPVGSILERTRIGKIPDELDTNVSLDKRLADKFQFYEETQNIVFKDADFSESPFMTRYISGSLRLNSEQQLYDGSGDENKYQSFSILNIERLFEDFLFSLWTQLCQNEYTIPDNCTLSKKHLHINRSFPSCILPDCIDDTHDPPVFKRCIHDKKNSPTLSHSKMGAVLHLVWRNVMKDQEGRLLNFHLDVDFICPMIPTKDKPKTFTIEKETYLLKSKPLGWLDELHKTTDTALVFTNPLAILGNKSPDTYLCRLKMIGPGTVIASNSKPFMKEESLTGERKKIYIAMKVLKEITGAKITSYRLKASVLQVFRQQPDKMKIGEAVEKVLRHYTNFSGRIGDHFRGICENLQKKGFLRVESECLRMGVVKFVREQGAEAAEQLQVEQSQLENLSVDDSCFANVNMKKTIASDIRGRNKVFSESLATDFQPKMLMDAVMLASNSDKSSELVEKTTENTRESIKIETQRLYPMKERKENPYKKIVQCQIYVEFPESDLEKITMKERIKKIVCTSTKSKMDLQFVKDILLEEHNKEILSFGWFDLDLVRLPWHLMMFEVMNITRGSTIITFQLKFKEPPRNQSDQNAYRLIELVVMTLIENLQFIKKIKPSNVEWQDGYLCLTSTIKAHRFDEDLLKVMMKSLRGQINHLCGKATEGSEPTEEEIDSVLEDLLKQKSNKVLKLMDEFSPRSMRTIATILRDSKISDKDIAKIDIKFDTSAKKNKSQVIESHSIWLFPFDFRKLSELDDQMFKDIILSTTELPPSLWYKCFAFHLETFSVEDVEKLRTNVDCHFPYPGILLAYKDSGGTLGGLWEALCKFLDKVKEIKDKTAISDFLEKIDKLRTEQYEKILDNIYCPSHFSSIKNINEFSTMSEEKGLKIKTNQMSSYENIKNDLRAGDQLWIYHKPSFMNSYAHVVVIINEEKYIHINAPNRMLAIKAKAIVKEEDRSRLCDELFCFVVRQDCPPDREQDIFSRRASICKGIRFDYNPDTSNCETFCNGVHGKWSTVQGARGKVQKTIKGYTKMKPSRAKDKKLTVQMQRKFKENGLILPEEII